MNNKAYAVPLHELLAGVPRGTRLEITDPDGMGTQFIPVGRYCHEAAEALRARLAQPQKEWVGLTDEEILANDVLRYHFALNGGAGPISKKGLAIIAAVNAKLKEKNT